MFCIWRGFKNKSDVCHVLCEELSMLVGPKSTQPPVASAASRLKYGRRRNANALRERGHIELIEPILAIITVEK